MENASSSCLAMRLMRAEASKSRMRGSLNCDRGRGGEQERGGGVRELERGGGGGGSGGIQTCSQCLHILMYY